MSMETGRKLTRRQVVSGGVLAAGAALLAACGGGSLPEPKAAEPAKPVAEPAKPAAADAKPASDAPKPPVPTVAPTPTPQVAAAKAGMPTLVVWKFGGIASELQYFVQWNEKFTNETGIGLEYSNNDWATKREKMLAAFQSKRIADVLLIDGQSMPDLASLGVIAPYDDLDKALMEKWRPNFIPEIWNSTVVDGKFYGPSSYVDMGTFLVYNKEMFAEAGISKVPENWDEVKEAARKLTKPDRAGITLSATTATNDANTLEGIAYANGGRWLDDAGKKVMIDDPGFVDPLQLYVDFVKDKVTPQGITETAFGQSATLFFEGKAAMWIALSYGKAIQQSQGRPDDFPMGMVLFPRQAKPTGFARPAATIMTPTAAVAISTLSEHKEAALKYADFWSRPDVQAGWDGSVIRGRVPALKANWETETFKKIYPDWYQLYKEGKMFDGSLPMPAFPGLVEAEKQLSTAMQQAILGQAAPKDALAAAAKRAQDIVDEFSKG
jgi:multiple sugar transport system substrate-binding protein